MPGPTLTDLIEAQEAARSALLKRLGLAAAEKTSGATTGQEPEHDDNPPTLEE